MGENRTQSGGTSATASPRAAVWRLWPLAVLATAGAALFASGVTRYLTLEQLLHSRTLLTEFVAAHFALALASYAAIYIGLALFTVPGVLLMTMTGGFLFGPVVGAVATVLAATTGASLLFLIARSSLGAVLRARAGPRINRLRAGFAENAVSYMLFLRIVPVFPFPLVNLAPALLGVSFRIFFWTTFVGMIPGAIAYGMIGAGMDSLFAAQEIAYNACVASGDSTCRLHVSPRQLVTPQLLLAFAAIGCLALAPVALKRLSATRSTQLPNPRAADR